MRTQKQTNWGWFKKYLGINTSLSSGENYLQAVNLIKSRLMPLGFKCQTVKIPKKSEKRPNRYNLVARKDFGKDLSTLVLYNHIDTVPADYPKAFLPFEEKDKIYARGACDMKGATAAVLNALERIETSRFNLLFLATTDEETYQKEQLNYLSKILKLPKETIVFDPDTEAGGVTIANLGLLQFDLHIKGKATHSAISHIGINAIEKSLEAMKFFLLLKQKYEKTISQMPTFETGGIKQACNRANINMIKGGIAPNVVADECVLTLDCRFIPEMDVVKEKTKLFAELEKFLKSQKINFEIKNIYTIEGYITKHPLAGRLEKIYEKITGEKGQYTVMGSTEVSEWTKYLRLAHFGIGVIRPDNNIHGRNEFVYKKDMESLAEALMEFIQTEKN